MKQNQNNESSSKQLSNFEILRLFKRIIGLNGPSECDNNRILAELKVERSRLPKINRDDMRKSVVEAVLCLSLKHPEWGPGRLIKALKEDGIDISANSIYNILVDHEMGTEFDRLIQLEIIGDLTYKQQMTLEYMRGKILEDYSCGKRPGQLLIQDTVYFGQVNGIGELYLQAVIDTFSLYAFVYLYRHKSSATAVSILHCVVLPYLMERQIQMEKILTNNTHLYCGNEKHPYELYLVLNNITHDKVVPKILSSNYYIRKFIMTIRGEFIQKLNFRDNRYILDELQSLLQQWVDYYNQRRSVESCPHMGRVPQDILENPEDILKS